VIAMVAASRSSHRIGGKALSLTAKRLAIIPSTSALLERRLSAAREMLPSSLI